MQSLISDKAGIDLYASVRDRPLAEVFAEPGSVFRGAPFWSWNTRLDVGQLLRQIDIFKEMGFGGFHMHSRTGMATPYLGTDFMAAIRACVEKAASEGMLAYLYDEDRWPSGFGGGLVTQDPAFRARHLLFTPRPYGDEIPQCRINDSAARAGRSGNGHLLARYAIQLNGDGTLRSSRRLHDGESAPEDTTEWFAYLESALPSEWFNGLTYVDTLNPRAIERFVSVTHDRYRETVGEYFGGVIPAIFTDEPQFCHKKNLSFPHESADLVIPWTGGLVESYEAAYDVSPLETIPELFWELPDARPSLARYRYHDHVAGLFASAFADTVGGWCTRNGLALTGHMMEERSLLSQTRALGEAMRSYRAFHLPGVDILCDEREFATLKQAQSAVHQYGRAGMTSELYGVTNWDFDFRGHKSQGDWQAALGVTLRVHHLAWVSMAGEAKRDYPASISYQSPWWPKYPLVEDHFARVNAVLTRGEPQVRIGVIHPIESYWLSWGPESQTALTREKQDRGFSKLTDWLLSSQLDFDFICEALLPEQMPFEEAAQSRFHVGKMAYEVVLVPPMRTMRATTLERLEAFVAAGGRVVFAGGAPGLVDAQPSLRPRTFAENAVRTSFTRSALNRALEPVRDIEVRTHNGAAHLDILYQWRNTGSDQFVFLCDTRREAAPMSDAMNGPGKALSCSIRLRGNWEVLQMDTGTGEISPHPSWFCQGWTTLHWAFHCHSHVLLQLQPSQKAGAEPPPVPPPCTARETLEPVLSDRYPVTLSEPNVLLLDAAEWRWNDEPWQPQEELLRLDNRIRKKMGLDARYGQTAQPWTHTREPCRLGALQLRFIIESDVDVVEPSLARELTPDLEIRLDGDVVPSVPSGWWVDEAIQVVPLPALKAGKHELLLSSTYQSDSGLEWCYLLGDFGVAVAGAQAHLTAPVRTLAWGDIARQGLPFYTGNITYHVSFENPATRDLAVHAPHYHGALISLQCNGSACPDIAFAPYESGLGRLAAGMVELDFTLYGNRFNAFGALHCAGRPRWAGGPDNWRTTDAAWCDEYQLRPLGILATPRLIG